jgi:hypothetical protein
VAFLWYQEQYHTILKVQGQAGSRMGLEGDEANVGLPDGMPEDFQLVWQGEKRRGWNPDVNLALRFVLKLNGEMISSREVAEIFSFVDAFVGDWIAEGRAPAVWGEVHFKQRTEFYNVLRALFPVFALCTRNYKGDLLMRI